MTSWKQNTWTDQLYHYAEYLYWEPQHINRKAVEKGSMQSFKDMQTKIRSKEVPLNILFNVMIQLLPFRLKQQILSCFVEPAKADFGERIDYITIYEKISNLDFIQPDVVLETEKAYVCIELKLDASLSPIPSPKISEKRAVDYHAFFIRPKKKAPKETTAHGRYNNHIRLFKPMSR